MRGLGSLPRESAMTRRRCIAVLALLLGGYVPVVAAAQSGNCGLSQPAFCETFESGPAPLSDRGRGNELSRTRFSVSRYTPSLSTGDGEAFWAWEGELGLLPGEPDTCRDDVPALLLPTLDTLICDPAPTIGTRYLLTVVGSQNYGSNAYRIRQPFDFAARTGRIVFDADLSNNLLLGYPSVVIAADPSPTPSWDVNGRGPNPREGLMLVFMGNAVEVHDVRDFAMTTLLSGASSTFPTARGRLARVELRLSQQQIEVLTSEPSLDGIVFSPLVSRRTVVFPQPLSFSRGYVSLLAHNHATWKYALTYAGTPRPMRSWNGYWDNVGFDGPVIDTTREYEIADAAVPSTVTTTDEFPPGTVNSIVHSGLSLGYYIPDGYFSEAMGEPLTFPDVSLANATRARLVFNGYYQGHDGNTQLRQGNGRLRYQLNEAPVHERAFTAGERAMLDEPGQTGGFNHTIDVPLSDLLDGDNTVRFATRNIHSGYPNAVVNVDLLIDFDLQRIFAAGFE